MPNSSELSERLTTAVLAAHSAGNILRHGFESGLVRYDTKSNRNDVVTEYDLRADETIVGILTTEFPEDTVLTEESGRTGSDDKGQWVVDPLDGTNNFSQNLPHFAVSIAYCVGEVPWIACIHDPIRGETFTAIRGGGAKLNERSLSTSNQHELDGAFLCVGTSIYPKLREAMHMQMPPFLQAARALRTSGSAALDLAYVAAGRFDAAWYPELNWWDVAAGILLIEEASGHCTSYCGMPFKGATSSILASNGPLHQSILNLLNDGCHGQA